jgi:hypothetical protein
LAIASEVQIVSSIDLSTVAKLTIYEISHESGARVNDGHSNEHGDSEGIATPPTAARNDGEK